jgi:hypothetical protein
MPPATYLLTHPNAGLTDAEKQQLIDGLSKTVGAGVGGGEGNEQQEGGS